MKQNQWTTDRLAALIGGARMEGGRVADGAVITVLTSPGCWGPMITPSIPSGHEVSAPIAVEGARPGDAVALFIEKIEVLSRYAASGTCKKLPENFDQDPTIHARCPHCREYYPQTELVGIGEEAVRCKKCGRPILPQTFESGYTVAIDPESGLGVSVDGQAAREIARLASEGKHDLPPASRQHPATVLAHADVDQMTLRCRPMIGNLGCVPAKEIPSAKNSGDLLDGLNATGLYEPVTADEITDGHMDIAHVGEGCVVLSPVRVEGAGVYAGDVHYLQGQGELAGHTLDISARVTLRVRILKGVALPGPILLPRVDELDPRFVPLSKEEEARAALLRSRYCATPLEPVWPLQIVGTGAGVDAAISCAVSRASRFLGISPGEVKNRATVTGGVGIGRTTGSAFLTMLLPETIWRAAGLLDLAREQYGR